ncbi:MAG: NADH-quinone oxidoreductase subunit J [Myxococcota bacterium]
MADDNVKKPERSTHYAEILGGLLLMAFLVAVVFWGAAKMLPGMAPVAAKGAELAKPTDLLFFLIAGVTMVSAAGVAFSRNIIYSALALLGALLGTGALYIFLNADYVAITQLLIYVGGVLVLILFAVMLTNRIDEKKQSNPMSNVFPGLGLLGALLLLFGFIAAKAPWKLGDAKLSVSSTVDKIGDLFLGHYLLAFEVISLLLLATLIGAVVIARKEIKE